MTIFGSAVPDRGEGRVGGQRSSSSEQGADQDPPSPLPLSPQARRGVPGGGGPSSLVLGPSSFETLAISATTGEGLDALVATVRQDLHLAPDTPAVNERHAASLALPREGLAMAQGVLAQDLPTDLATVGLQPALTALGAITGQTAEPDLIERLFSDFCLGK